MAAIRALSTPLKVDLLRHYAEYGGSMNQAAQALDATLTTVSRATRDLIEAGVVVDLDAGNPTSTRCAVDHERLDEILAAVASYIHTPRTTPYR